MLTLSIFGIIGMHTHCGKICTAERHVISEVFSTRCSCTTTIPLEKCEYFLHHDDDDHDVTTLLLCCYFFIHSFLCFSHSCDFYLPSLKPGSGRRAKFFILRIYFPAYKTRDFYSYHCLCSFPHIF